MRSPIQESEFSSDYVDLLVEYHRGEEPLIDTAFAEDLRYWSDGTEDPIGDDKIYLRRPQASTYIPVSTADDIGFGRLLLPEKWLQRVNAPVTPLEMEFLMTRPSYTSQLERFDDD